MSDSICPACRTGSFIVRDMLGRCSECHARVMSIDYLHTCCGGELCDACRAKRITPPAAPPGSAPGVNQQDEQP
jgi:hypothetical protein